MMPFLESTPEAIHRVVIEAEFFEPHSFEVFAVGVVPCIIPSIALMKTGRSIRGRRFLIEKKELVLNAALNRIEPLNKICGTAVNTFSDFRKVNGNLRKTSLLSTTRPCSI